MFTEDAFADESCNSVGHRLIRLTSAVTLNGCIINLNFSPAPCDYTDILEIHIYLKFIIHIQLDCQADMLGETF